MTYNQKIPPFKWFILENFPYIEEDFDALTNWQLFCKLGKEMNKIIQKCNLTGEQVENLTNAFESLQTYVNNYFDNLDVQSEIDTKLDEMAEDGTLADIIAQYIQLQGILTYNSVAEMKEATNLVNGSFVETYGYYSNGDGGSAKYKIRQVTNQDVEDDMFIIALADENLVAELLVVEPLNVLQVGVKNDNSADVSSKLNTITENHSMFLPVGQYKVENTINLKHSMYGEGFARDNSNDNGQTILISSVVDKTIKIVGNSEQSTQNIKNIKIRIDSETTDSEVVRYDPINNQTRCFINEVAIMNFCGCAFWLDAQQIGSGFVSRGVYIDTICLIARPYQNSTGIYCNNTVSDNRFSNLEMMFVKSGINNKGVNMVDNAHIWTGGTGEDVDDWWNETRGVINTTGALQMTNIYIDTSLIALVNNGGTIQIDNFTYWIDNSISGSTHYDASIVYGNSFEDRLKTQINNARIFIGERIKYINGKITNLTLLYNSLSNLDFNSLREVEDLTYELTYTQSTSTSRYLPVAILQRQRQGYVELNITGDGGQNSTLKFSYDWNNTISVKGTYFYRNNNYYYKADGNKYIIYMESSLQNMYIRVTVNGKSQGLFPINLNDLVNRGNNGKFIADDYITTDSTGLTQITQTQVNP